MSINGRTLSRLSPCIRRTCRSDRFYALLAPWSCGAFDGGCLIVALALRQALDRHALRAVGQPDHQDEVPTQLDARGPADR